MRRGGVSKHILLTLPVCFAPFPAPSSVTTRSLQQNIQPNTLRVENPRWEQRTVEDSLLPGWVVMPTGELNSLPKLRTQIETLRASQPCLFRENGGRFDLPNAWFPSSKGALVNFGMSRLPFPLAPILRHRKTRGLLGSLDGTSYMQYAVIFSLRLPLRMFCRIHFHQDEPRYRSSLCAAETDAPCLSVMSATRAVSVLLRSVGPRCRGLGTTSKSENKYEPVSVSRMDRRSPTSECRLFLN